MPHNPLVLSKLSTLLDTQKTPKFLAIALANVQQGPVFSLCSLPHNPLSFSKLSTLFDTQKKPKLSAIVQYDVERRDPSVRGGNDSRKLKPGATLESTGAWRRASNLHQQPRMWERLPRRKLLEEEQLTEAAGADGWCILDFRTARSPRNRHKRLTASRSVCTAETTLHNYSPEHEHGDTAQPS